MSGVRAAYVDDDVHVVTNFMDYGFGYQHALFGVQKEAFTSAAAYIHLLYPLVAEVAGYGLYSLHIYGTVLFKGSVKGDGYVTEFVCVVL